MLTKEIQYSFLCPECGLIHLSNIGYKEECQQNVCSDQNYLNFCLGLPLNIGKLTCGSIKKFLYSGIRLKGYKKYNHNNTGRMQWFYVTAKPIAKVIPRYFPIHQNPLPTSATFILGFCFLKWHQAAIPKE